MRAGDLLARGFLRLVRRGWRRFLWEILSRCRKYVTVRTKQGIFTVFVGPHEYVGKALFLNRGYELDFMAASVSFLRRTRRCPPMGRGTILNVGGNIGAIAVGMLYRGEFERAIVLEPEPRNFSLLLRNVRANGLEARVICLPYAASHVRGVVRLELSDDNSGDHRVLLHPRVGSQVETVPVSRRPSRRSVAVLADQIDNLVDELPDLFTRSISLLWIDVQGHEGYAFMGARALLSSGIPVVSEVWPYGIRQSGLGDEEFLRLAAGLWTEYWVLRDGKFVGYPIRSLGSLFDEIGYDGNYENVIFTA